MQSSHDVLRQNILSNWFATSSLSKQLHQAPFFGQDTDVIYLHSCDLNTKFDFTVPSLQFLRLNVVFGQFVFVSSLVKRRQHMLPTNRQNFGLTRRREISIHCTGYGESSKESSVFFLWAKLFIMKLFFEEFNLICFTVERLTCFEMQPRQRRFGEF